MKACPFCGSPHVDMITSKHSNSNLNTCYIECIDCSSRGPRFITFNSQKLVENTAKENWDQIERVKGLRVFNFIVVDKKSEMKNEMKNEMKSEMKNEMKSENDGRS